MNATRTTLIITLAALAFSCSQNQEDLEADISIPVSVIDVGKSSIEKYISTTGTVYPTNQVILKAEVSGDYNLQINPKTRQPYKLGDFVQKGAVIVKIADEEFVNNLNISGKKLNLEISNQTLEKQKSLFEKGGASQLEVKNAEVDAVNASNSYEAALISLKKMSVKAPFSGIIVDLPQTTGGVRVDAGFTILEMMDFQKLYLEVSFPEKQLTNIRENQEVRITNYSLPNDTIFGKIKALSPAIDAETRTFKGSLVLDNPKLTFRPGMFVKAELVLERKDSVIVIPKEVILSKQRGNTVFIVQRGAAQERVITTGLDNPDEIEVIDGLSENDRLIIKGFETLSNRSKVSIVQ
jgi:RND family efflux transporter MFP subunit